MRELIIDSIRVGLRHYRRVVVLRERDAERYLTIWIGSDVADAIAFRLQEVTVPRPQTHDLMLDLIRQLGGTVREITISDLKDDTFFAVIKVAKPDGSVLDIDARPSDAIAIAVRAEVPIYADEAVLDAAGILLEEEGLAPAEDEVVVERPVPPTAEELEKLAAFRDFVAGLDLDDLGAPPD